MKPFINSAENAKAYPKTWIHPVSAIANLRKGMHIKIGVAGDEATETPGERFWAKVTSVSPKKNRVVAVIEQSDMLFGHIHGYHHGDTVVVTADNIMMAVWL